MINETRVEKAVEFIRDHAEEYGKLVGLCKSLEYRRKQARSMAFLESTEPTVAAKEADADASQAVTVITEEIENAFAERETLATRMKAAELTVDVWRSLNASRRLVDKVHQ